MCATPLITGSRAHRSGGLLIQELVARLGEWSPLPCTYAGGAKDLDDLSRVQRLSNGRVGLTYGSALDLFGGTGVRCVPYGGRQPVIVGANRQVALQIR